MKQIIQKIKINAKVDNVLLENISYLSFDCELNTIDLKINKQLDNSIIKRFEDLNYNYHNTNEIINNKLIINYLLYNNDIIQTLNFKECYLIDFNCYIDDYFNEPEYVLIFRITNY